MQDDTILTWHDAGITIKSKNTPKRKKKYKKGKKGVILKAILSEAQLLTE